ncbi:probable serine/threonine-protein kinase At1g54610 isoform X1 [Salvia splendens]|uniref:probable serine/threonine-protein kinase At1g54610 isoform X1 n=1 Tax=Salvia splendens TaxID=180675 RepID=UPI001C262FCE|nr:probable serine/threonine-protein kinase At1g54610 isoform X1 [Salvia splendens]
MNGVRGRRKSVGDAGGGIRNELVDVWPKWLTDNIPAQVLKDIVPKSSDSYIKIDKIGAGTYSNVYKARDRATGETVALKKVRFDTSEAESIKFMAREIRFLQRLDHPNIIKLKGLATSRMQFSIYLVFEYMHSDLSRILSRPDERLTESQIKCYMQQLLSGLNHCHERGVLHRDIKPSNLLIDKNGTLKLADFGLANLIDPKRRKRPLTSCVVTLWYRAPELLLGSTDYGVGIDLWSVGCLMAEMFAGRPILPGRTEAEQVHIIFKLCGTPPDEYFKGLKLSTSLINPAKTYKSSLAEKCRNFPSSAISLLTILLALHPSLRGSAASALDNKFFQSSPSACGPSGLPDIRAEDKDQVPINERRTHRSSRVRRSQKEEEKGR